MLGIITKLIGQDAIMGLIVQIVNRILKNSDAKKEARIAFAKFVRSLDIHTPVKMADEMEQLIEEAKLNEVNKIQELYSENMELKGKLIQFKSINGFD